MGRDLLKLLPGLALFALVCGWTVLSRAQDESEAPAPSAPGNEAEAEAPPVEKSPLVGEPKTPEELFEAAVLMADVARPDLAKLYLDKLLEQADDEVLLGLRDKLGAAPFVRLTLVKELKTTAEKLLDRSNTAMLQRAADPARAAQLLAQLDGTPEEAAAATLELKSAGPLAAPALLTLLASAAHADQHQRIMEVLVEMGEPVVPQLLGALEAPQDEFRAEVATVLGHLRSSQAEMSLWRLALGRDEPASVRTAAREALARILNRPDAEVERLASAGLVPRLVREAGLHYRGEYPWTAGEDGRVTLWSWSTARKTVVPLHLPPDAASDIAGLRLAKDALALAPEERPVQVLYLNLALAADIRKAGFDQPLPVGPGTAHDLALSVGSDVALDVLAEALASGRPVTAVAALRVLEQVGKASQLAAPPGKRSPILAALDYPDPRVQFSAAATILQLDPQGPFRGASRVVEVLSRAAAAEGGKPVAVVGEVSAGRGSATGGFLAEMGYQPLVFLSGRDAFSAAAARSDVELIVLHPNVIRWALSETLANLRADSRTASIPIVIYGPSDLRARLQPHLRNFRLVSFASLAYQTGDFESQVQPVVEQLRTPPMTAQQRAAQRAAAVAWLAHIAQSQRTKTFDITGAETVLSDALADPKLAGPALDALGEIATRTAQSRLAEMALGAFASSELRESAAVKLAFHIQRFGLLLSQDTLGALHRAWADETQPADVRTALGGVIGSLNPNTGLVGKRLKDFSASPSLK